MVAILIWKQKMSKVAPLYGIIIIVIIIIITKETNGLALSGERLIGLRLCSAEGPW